MITFLGRNNRIRRKKKGIWYDRKETDAPSCIDRRTADAVHKSAAGCRQQEKQEVTPEVLMDAVDKNMKEVNSASSSLEIEVELEDVLDHTRIRMDMDMENTVSPEQDTQRGGGSEAK